MNDKEKYDFSNEIAQINLDYQDRIRELIKNLSDLEIKDRITFMKEEVSSDNYSQYLQDSIRLFENELLLRSHFKQAKQIHENGGSGMYCVYHGCDIVDCSNKH